MTKSLKPTPVEVTVSNRTLIRALAIIIITFLLFRFINNVAHVLELIFVACFLAIALNPTVGWIATKLKIKSRAAATGIAYLAVVVLLSGFLSFVVPPLISQTVDFVRGIPQTITDLKDDRTTAGHFVRRYNLSDQVDGLSQNVKDRTKNIQQPVISTATRVGSALIAILTVLVLTFMMLVEGPIWIDRFWRLAFRDTKAHEHNRQLARQMYRIITGYVNGQLLLSVIGATLSLVALLISSTLLHVSINAVALAGILLITGLIPMIGHLLGASIIVVACAFVSLPLAIIMAIFLLVHQQVENITLQPYIQAKYNELTPLLVFVAALLGIGFGGLIGAFVAIPAVGCAKILFVDYVSRRHALIEKSE
ncbi:MAG: AI-2E family transporter [Candidatus Saccharimonadales bacterium]